MRTFLGEPVELPLGLLTSNLENLDVGDTAWVGPGALVVDKEFHCWINLRIHIPTREDSDFYRTLRVTRRAHGFEVGVPFDTTYRWGPNEYWFEEHLGDLGENEQYAPVIQLTRIPAYKASDPKPGTPARPYIPH